MPFFPIAGPFRFCFFHAAQAPLRVSQNDSSGQSVFLGQLVEEHTIYSHHLTEREVERLIETAKDNR